MSHFQHWSFGRKILVGSLAFLILPLLLIFSASLQYFTTKLDASTEEELIAAGASLAREAGRDLAAAVSQHLKAIAGRSEQLVREQHQKQLAGLLTEHTAKQELVKMFAARPISAAGAVFILDAQGILMMHPDPSLVGKGVLQIEDFSQAPALASALNNNEWGYLEYERPASQGRPAQPMALYLLPFQPWDWIIAVTCSRDEIGRLVGPQAIADNIEAFRFGVSGFAVLLDNEGRMLTRPFANDVDNSAFNNALNTALGSGNVTPDQVAAFSWKTPGEATSKQRLATAQPIIPFGLTIGVVTDRRETVKGLVTMPTLVALIMAGGTVLALSLALMFSRLVTAPLRRLTSEMDLPDNTRLAYTGGCEVAFLRERLEHALKTLRKANERLSAEALARKSTENFLKIYKQVFDSATEGLVITDATGKILGANGAFTTITGYTLPEAMGNNPRILKSDRHDADFYQDMWRQLTEKGCWEGEIWNKKKDGTVYPEWLTINSIRNDQQEIVYYFASFYEIGELKRKDKQIAFMAHHDMLTMLPNRTFLEQKLARAIARIRAEGGKLSLFFIDLDNFKNVNDVFGHKFGDDLLVQVTKRFASALGDNDSLYRMSSDEFVLMMDQVDNESVVYLMANRILAILKKPFLLDFKKIYVNASVGVSIFPGDGENALEMIRSADMAMHRAKRAGKNRFLLFTKEMHVELYERFRIENSIRYGLVNKEFVVFYQPKVNIANRTTASLEALIRWNKGGTLVSPSVFIPIAEESSLIDQICTYVLEESCAFHRLMADASLAIPISVNISPRQFHNADFIDIVEDLLLRYDVDPKYVEFEVTETTAMSDVENTLRIMHRLREMGIHFSIDDFGTGYSSLGYLSRMPVSTLKIDKQFVQNMEQNSGLVATIIAIGQQMHLNVVAEGVETEEQLQALTAMGCHEIQGYYFSRPIDANQTLQYLEAERSSVAGR